MSLSYLHTPVVTIIDPPIDTKAQELPLEKLSWEDFEKLCLAIVQTEFSINDCEIYGTKGQEQHGIDICAQQSNLKYKYYQSKRYQKFGVSDLNKAITAFKKGKFFEKCESFYLCTSCKLNKTQIQDRFDVLKKQFSKKGISLVKWDKIQISTILKKHPQIVFDFFGKAWVKKFNGESFLAKISKSKKLDATQTIEYRKELYEFYSTIFNLHDQGIPIKDEDSPYTIQDRYIVPDILSSVKEESFENNIDTSSSTSAPLHLYAYDRDEHWYSQAEEQLRLKNQKPDRTIEDSSIDFRIGIDDVIANSNKNIIIGDPGAGKSTLLRYLALDMLSSNPQLENISLKYGKSLPVWLPFAFITKHLSQDDSLSISQILKLWFNGFGKKHLFDIANSALKDERLFLIIDGIDEWNSISSAQQAITRIETLRKLYDCQILYSSRPYGFRLLKDFFTNLNILNLAGFSNLQQRAFVEKWYNKYAAQQENITNQNFSKRQTENFFKDLEQTGDLKKLAKTPLLLGILIIQKIRNSVLPKNKIQALKEITQYLINKHPVKRTSDAGIVQDEINDISFNDIFCELAIYIQKESNDGVILKDTAQNIITTYLIEYGDYDKVKAKMRSRELIGIGANNFGIIIEKSNNEISFSHKQFQEFLAAQYLFESDEDSAINFIKEFGSDPTSHQVISNLFGLIPLKQVKKFERYFDMLNLANSKKYQENYLKLISYEVVINSENAPSKILNNAYTSITAEFEYETDQLYKRTLLKIILSALHNSRLRERAQIFLTQYFPNKSKYKDYRVSALRYSKQLNSQQIEFLKKAFINGTILTRYDASYAFKKHIKNKQVYSFIKDLILNCSNPEILALAINSIITEGLALKKIDTLIKSIETEAPIVKLFVYKYNLFFKKNTEKDFKDLLNIINDISGNLEEEVIQLLFEVKSKSKDYLKTILLNSVNKRNSFGGDTLIIGTEIAWKVLFHCYNTDSEVINLMESKFNNDDFPFGFMVRSEIFSHLNFYFKDNTKLIKPVENWINRRLEKHNYISPEIANASIFAHTESMKNILLEDLPKTGISHWNVMALLEGWPNDSNIKDKLKTYFRTIDIEKTSTSAHHISKIFNTQEKEEAIKILEAILLNNNSMFRARAIPALIEIDKNYFEENILEKVIGELDQFSKYVFGHYYSSIDAIVKEYHTIPIVKSYILERIENDYLLYNLAVQYYPDLVEKEVKLLRKSMPLADDLRLTIIDYFNELSSLPANIEMALSNFEQEEEEEVKADMAICLFDQIKDTNKNKILDLSSPLVFAKGVDHEVKRNIGFTGFLVSKSLDQYYSMRDIINKREIKASPTEILISNNYVRSSSKLMIRSIIDNFDYLMKSIDNNLELILEGRKSSKEIENSWSFIASNSVRSSPTYPYIMRFITESVTTISSNSIINFLNRTSPKSSILKNILLRIISSIDENNKALAGELLGTNFKDDSQVYEVVKNIDGISDYGRIIALCNGWPNEPILRETFDELVKNQSNYHIDYHVGFNLKFLFRDVANLTRFFDEVFLGGNDIKSLHKYFFIPMIERLKRDSEFRLEVKKLLLSSGSITEKISFYNLLSQVNQIDDDIIIWKSKISDFKNDYGYDIVSNKTIRLKDVLYDYYF